MTNRDPFLVEERMAEVRAINGVVTYNLMVYCVTCIPAYLYIGDCMPVLPGDDRWRTYPVCDVCGKMHTYTKPRPKDEDAAVPELLLERLLICVPPSHVDIGKDESYVVQARIRVPNEISYTAITYTWDV